MVDSVSTVDGRGVKIAVYRCGRATWEGALRGVHGDHGAMAEPVLVDHRSPDPPLIDSTPTYRFAALAGRDWP